jgi:TRAP-type C4-dicarboxylate transport system substrate-binding protein
VSDNVIPFQEPTRIIRDPVETYRRYLKTWIAKYAAEAQDAFEKNKMHTYKVKKAYEESFTTALRGFEKEFGR